MQEYSELQITTNFSFLRGGSHPEEMVEQAIALGYQAIAITDRNTLAGIVRAYSAAKGKNIRIIPACRLDFMEGPSLLAYPQNKRAYSQLSALLSKGNLRAEKGECYLYPSDVYGLTADIIFMVVPPFSLNHSFDFDESFKQSVSLFKEAFGTNLYLGATRSYLANDNKRLYRLSALSQQLNIPLAATNDVHYHNRSRRALQDILSCIREQCTIQQAGFRLHQNAERHLKTAAEMHRLFHQYPQAIQNAIRIAESCTFSLNELTYVYPKEITSANRTPQQELRYLVWEGAKEKFGNTLPAQLKTTIEHELSFIERKDYAAYFLTVYDLVSFARQRGILCQGRGSAANSVVCFCLGITSVNPSKFKLLFARFMSDARNEPPDIDVDFEHERREEVIQYIYAKYGRDRAAIVATVTQVHYKGAIRDVAKAMGLSLDAINRLSGSGWEFTEEWLNGNHASSEGFNPNDPHLKKVFQLTAQYIGFPRQLGQHTGGFVITQDKLSDLCPILNARMENRTCIEWNKDDIETLGFLKIDVLALGMLTCIRKAFDLAEKHYGLNLTLANIPQDDPQVYEMISRADTIGVFQIESRAQMTMLPRLKPKCFYDLVIEVAIVRPGPIQGDMIHPYLRRRNGQEPVEYPSAELEEILGRTLGVPLFQEQAMEIAIVAAGFTPAEADGLRRSMATFKAKGKVSDWEKKLIKGMIAKGYKEEFAKRVFRQLEGFGSYGFPESHAASFALLVYVSSWIKCFYPDVFAAALLNSMPMGFYQPAQIVSDAIKHGVEVRAADVNDSFWDNSLEEKAGKYYAIRLGFRQIKGLAEADVQRLLLGRKTSYQNVHALSEAGVSLAAIEKLADADAFRSMGLDRRQALWQVSALADRPIGMFTGQPSPSEQNIQLPAMTKAEHIFRDYSTSSLSLKGHPVSLVREKLAQLHIVETKQLAQLKNGDSIKVAGLVLVRQRPGTASGVVFVTIEDETGIANLVVFKKVFDFYKKELIRATLLMVEGKLQIEGSVIHVIVEKCHNLTRMLQQLPAVDTQADCLLIVSRADEDGSGYIAPGKQHTGEMRQGEIFPAGRNFK